MVTPPSVEYVAQICTSSLAWSTAMAGLIWVLFP
jgi:hypothetical protein